MIELKRVRCTKCGAEFTDNYDPAELILRCTRVGCGATFVLNQAQDLAIKYPNRDLDLQNLRMLLDEAVREGDADLMVQRAQEIRSFVPEDAFASYIEALGQKRRGHYKLYHQFFAISSEMTHDDAERILSIALEHEHYSDHDRVAILSFINDQLDGAQKSLWRMKLDNAITRLLEDQERYSVIPRDVFICHSSADSIALEVYRVLTEDGVKCWISEENLPPKTDYYWPKIEEAISNCKIILVVCSQSTMLREDPVKEMRYADSLDLDRLEFKVDDTPHTTFFRHYFDGIQWIKLNEQARHQSFDELKDRVYRLLHTVQEPDLNPTSSLGLNADPIAGIESVSVPIVLSNKKVEIAIRASAGLFDEEPITEAALARMKNLDISDCELNDISFLKYASSLDSLDASSNRIRDVAPLFGLKNLKSLQISNNQIQDITPLSGLRSLSILYMDNNKISNIDSLEGLVLVELSLSRNQINDISALRNTLTLKKLYLSHNVINNVSPLRNLTSLRKLGLSGNQIVNISALQSLTDLDFLSLNKNQIKNVAPLAGLKKLLHLRIADNPVTDYFPLLDIASLKTYDVKK